MFGDAKASINLQISYEIISVHHPRNVDPQWKGKQKMDEGTPTNH
jgi:hypothetical protein